MRKISIPFLSVSLSVLGLGLVGGILATPASAQAQAEKPLPPISLDLRDAPIRQALEQLFGSANVQFSIDNNVAGFVTLKIVDQPFDNALRVLLRSSSEPLSYTKENGVYFIKPRVLMSSTEGSTAPAPPDSLTTGDTDKKFASLEMIQLTYADPYDFTGILGVSILRNFQREGQGGNGGMGSGSRGSGMGSGMMGGMGGMGGMMGGMGGMMGGMGGMSGGYGGMSGGYGGMSGGYGGMSGGYGGGLGGRL